jgi:hypothetical protein
MRKRVLLITAVICFFTANPVYADAVPLVGSPALWSAAIFEAFLIAVILSFLGFYMVRVFFVWLPLNFVTLYLLAIILLVWWDVGDALGKIKFFEELPDYMETTGYILAIVIGEIIIVFLEALAMCAIFNRRFFRQKADANLFMKRAIGLSALINFISFVMGFVFLHIYQILNLE